MGDTPEKDTLESETPLSQEQPMLGYDHLDPHWAELKARGVPQAVIGMIARRKGAAPGQRNYHGK